MWFWNNSYDVRREGTNGLVAVAIEKDKNSQFAFKWAIDHLMQKGQTVVLIHVKVTPFSSNNSPRPSSRLNQISDITGDSRKETRDLFLPFHCFCTRKDIQCKDVVLEATDVTKGLVEYVTQTAIKVLVMGASTNTSFLRFKATDIPGMVSKHAPDFCSVYVITKSKISSMRSASRHERTKDEIVQLREQFAILKEENVQLKEKYVHLSNEIEMLKDKLGLILGTTNSQPSQPSE